MDIAIASRTSFLAKQYSDLDIAITFKSKQGDKEIQLYENLISYYRSTFGNCFFELRRWDSSTKINRDITFEVMGVKHPPGEFENEEEILKYDLKKTRLSAGKGRVLKFNVLDFIGGLPQGRYSLKVYLRVANNYGYDNKGHVVENSLVYIESRWMNFDVMSFIKRPPIPIQ